MLSFFRSIRRSLINEGKTVKYLKYAVGEFLLIVAGILVALQIQNWNEGIKLEQDRRELIEGLKSDFLLNAQRLDDALQQSSSDIESIRILLTVINDETKLLTPEDLKTHFLASFQGQDFRPVLGTYETALSTGKIGLIDAQVLNELLIEFVDTNARFQAVRQIALENYFLHGVFQMRQRAGSIAQYYSDRRFNLAPIPNSPVMNTKEAMDFFRENDVYAIFENQHFLKVNRHNRLLDLAEKTEQILAALEALD